MRGGFGLTRDLSSTRHLLLGALHRRSITEDKFRIAKDCLLGYGHTTQTRRSKRHLRLTARGALFGDLHNCIARAIAQTVMTYQPWQFEGTLIKSHGPTSNW